MRRYPGLTLAILLTSSLAVRATAAEPWREDHPLRTLKDETLVYQATSWKGIGPFRMAIPVGTSTFTVTRETVDGERHIVMKAQAKGGVPGYPYDATMTSRLREADLSPVEFDSNRLLPEYKRRIIRYHGRGADYLKHKHCDAPTLCHNPAHDVDLPDGKRGHCPGCHKPEHYVWSLRYRHRGYEGAAYDLLSGNYLSRGLPIRVGGPVQTVRVISNRDMFDIEITPVAEETVTVPAGKIDCIKVTLANKPANAYSRGNASDFEGPFGLHGDVVLYLDKATLQPVRVTGKVKLGATFDVQIDLKERGSGEAPPDR